VIENGNPADSALAWEKIERQSEIYGKPPRRASFYEGFASQDNLADIKELGVKDVIISKKRGPKVVDMGKSSYAFKKQCNFRVGIQGMISFL